VGRDLVASAWTADGLVEALEDPRSDRFVMAVQWHPELGWERDSFSQALFSCFISEAVKYARSTRREMVNAEQAPE
jgi:putative glutamine amidotransferase